jgi:hypothetical protein
MKGVAVTGQLSLIDGVTNAIDVQVAKNKGDIEQGPELSNRIKVNEFAGLLNSFYVWGSAKINAKLTSQTITDEFIYISVQGNERNTWTTYCMFDLNLQPPNLRQTHRDFWWGQPTFLWLQGLVYQAR